MEPSPTPRRSLRATLRLAVVLSLSIGLLVMNGIGYWYETHPMLAIVNTSDHRTLRVFMDGVLLIGDLRQGLPEREALENFVKLRLASGTHQMMILDGEGKLVEERTITLQRGRVHLYAPAHSNEVAWTVQSEEPGLRSRPAVQVLDTRECFWNLPLRKGMANIIGPETWFQAPGAETKTAWSALRQHDIHDPAFAPRIETAENR